MKGARAKALLGRLAFGAPAGPRPPAHFTEAERRVILEVRGLLQSCVFAQIKNAFRGGESAEFRAGGRTIVVEPAAPVSGMTCFGENGYVLGREAFASEEELVKTLLHETYRLDHSLAARGVCRLVASRETATAFQFAERAYREVVKR